MQMDLYTTEELETKLEKLKAIDEFDSFDDQELIWDLIAQIEYELIWR